ncbi:MAG: homogentisate 1,2-dioxygenase [Candidatus Eremiobacteraeota bacterium]|nr:homogentisate 1,2-dioxygenase [Candidatus Eremiobacteraeota bacterium]MCW5866211.1 homogentisate 1,2-dioxygenase [Candidatus Eremiobacteraeota bacterium]
MPFYHHLGQLPPKRHTQFRNPQGVLYTEEVMGLEGFSGIQSLLYHNHPPTRIKKAEKIGSVDPGFVDFGALRARQFRTNKILPQGDALEARQVLLGNDDVWLGMSLANKPMDYFYRNSQAYEVWFLHQGEVKFRSQFGNLDLRAGDYLVIPYGVTWQMLTDSARFFTIECPSQVQPPKRYRNQHGQLLEHSPYCERDIRIPTELETHDQLGEFEVRVKARNELHRHILAQHPLGVVGWDGYLYPWVFNINDFEPITGRVHQPPPVHQTFDAHNFVVCSFCPRLFDYHPLAIPAPYNHSNVNSDEVLYYVDGDFMSRRGVELGDWTLHPSGLPHGPQPGATEASIGKKETQELAVMVDTFRPLKVSEQALALEVPEYAYSWVS